MADDRSSQPSTAVRPSDGGPEGASRKIVLAPIASATPEVRAALEEAGTSFQLTALFSCFVNLALLTVPLYMLQLYDRVLTSRSESTLVALTALAVAMLAGMGALDWIRSRVLVRVGAGLDEKLGGRVFSAVFAQTLRMPGGARSQYLRDLDSLRQFLTGSGPFALFDAPWLPIYLLVVFLLHPILGGVALVGAVLLLVVALANELSTRRALDQAGSDSIGAASFAEAALRNSEVLEALGMLGGIRARWSARHRRALAHQAVASDRAGTFTALSKGLRLLLQVAVLGTGAALVIQQSVSPGAMIAASILASRALAPVEQAIANWRGFTAARQAYGRLSALLKENPAVPARMRLPAPRGELTVENLVGAPPGATRPVLRDISFSLEPGEALGIVGPTASGKSTLARHLVGVWPPARGSVRLDGASLADWNRDELGYLPQDVELFEGTVAENVSRFEANPTPDAIVAAARQAGVHEMILGLPMGYDTPIGVGGTALSAGQRQRVALARALYGDPVLVVLDEPNASLDVAGDQALTGAILGLRKRGATVVVIAHRPAAISAVDRVLVLKEGQVAALGPKEQVLTGPVRVGRPPGLQRESSGA
jgi:PrtD family type I secretion system ABC transporter